jgi:hypothetical protein
MPPEAAVLESIVQDCNVRAQVACDLSRTLPASVNDD